MMEHLASTRLGAWFFLNIATPLDRHVLKWTRGRVSTAAGTKFNQFYLLLTTKGAKSNVNRTVPLLATFDKEDIILIGSRGGYPNNPSWYYNLKKNPEAMVEYQGETFTCRAHEAKGKERERLWHLAEKNYSGYQKYQDNTPRKIPVMILRRIDTE
jgi:deazaflavin-dependent oxidoreductase (nitroreductase family)